MGAAEIGDSGLALYHYSRSLLCVGAAPVALFRGSSPEWMMKSFSMGLFIVILGELALTEKD